MKTLRMVISVASVIVMSGTGATFAQGSTPEGTSDEIAPAATATSPAPKVNESPLVKAAKSGGPKKKSRISITDQTVKKSGGKLIEMKTTVESANRPVAPAAEKKEPDAKPPVNAQLERDKNVKATQDKVEQARQQVSELEKELSRLEEDYYNEDDPAVRDDVIQRRFEDTKKRLESARQDLAAARANADAAASAPLTERRD